MLYTVMVAGNPQDNGKYVTPDGKFTFTQYNRIETTKETAHAFACQLQQKHNPHNTCGLTSSLEFVVVPMY